MIQLFGDDGVEERMSAYRKAVKEEIRECLNPPKWRGNRISILFRDMKASTKRNPYQNL